MGKKKRRGHSDPVRKWIKRGISWAGKIVGAGVALSPSYRGLGIAVAGNPQEGFKQLTWDVAGIDTTNPGMPDIGRVAGTVITVAAGIGIMILFGAVAKRV